MAYVWVKNVFFRELSFLGEKLSFLSIPLQAYECLIFRYEEEEWDKKGKQGQEDVLVISYLK